MKLTQLASTAWHRSGPATGARGEDTTFRWHPALAERPLTHRVEDSRPMQDVYGQAKDAATSAAEAIRETASEAGDFIRDTIERRPYTAAAVALAVGFLVGRFGRTN